MQNAARNFSGKLGYGGLDLAARRGQFAGNAFLGRAHLGRGFGARFFELMLANTMEGFFADPIYGGNRDMAGWKLIGFPGARYDYRDWVERHNEPYPLPPVSILGRSEWEVK